MRVNVFFKFSIGFAVVVAKYIYGSLFFCTQCITVLIRFSQLVYPKLLHSTAVGENKSKRTVYYIMCIFAARMELMLYTSKLYRVGQKSGATMFDCPHLQNT